MYTCISEYRTESMQPRDMIHILKLTEETELPGDEVASSSTRYSYIIQSTSSVVIGRLYTHLQTSSLLRVVLSYEE